MRLRSFTAPTMSEALRLVRDEFGENAVIVNTETESSGQVRISAATESPAFVPQQRSESPSRVADPLQEALEPHELIADILRFHGVSARAQDSLMLEIEARPPVPTPEGVTDLLTYGLKRVLQFDLRPPLPSNDMPVLLVGAQGAGKTTLAAKMLTSLRMGNEPIAAMTTDTVRAGAIGQLSAFTNLLSCPLLEIEDAFALPEGIAQYRDKDHLVIDTAGANPYDADDMQACAELVCAASGSRVVLALPAGLDVRETSWVTSAFARAGAQALLITRSDTARRLGGVITAAIESGLQITGISATPAVTEPPRALTPRALATFLIERSDIELSGEDLETHDHATAGLSALPELQTETQDLEADIPPDSYQTARFASPYVRQDSPLHPTKGASST